MKHLNEKGLILCRYGEARDKKAVELHLTSCASCREAFANLEAALAALELFEVPERDETYGARVWERLRPRLEEQLDPGWRRWFGARRLAMAGALAALLFAAFLAGRHWAPHEVRQAMRQPVPAHVRERILLVAVGDHLERSQMVLIELTHARGDGTVDISAERHRAEDLVESNRLYRLAAARAGQSGVASVLDDLERVLLEIARSPSRVSSKDLEAFRRRIEAQGILFKVRVIDLKVREQGKLVVRGPKNAL